MNLRRCQTPRADGLTHLFHEGEEETLCSRVMTDDYKVRSNDAVPTCRYCVLALARLQKEENSSLDFNAIRERIREREEA